MNGRFTLRQLRLAKDWTQGHLSKLTGISRPIISEHETGRIEPTLRLLDRYAEVYGVTRDAIAVGVKRQSSSLARQVA